MLRLVPFVAVADASIYQVPDDQDGVVIASTGVIAEQEFWFDQPPLAFEPLALRVVKVWPVEWRSWSMPQPVLFACPVPATPNPGAGCRR